MIRYVLTVVLFLITSFGYLVFAQDVATERKDIPYYANATDDYQQQMCLLDIYIPTDTTNFSTIVWFHGGGLTGGQKEIPAYLKDKGVAVVGVGYRFSPHVRVEQIIQDAAQAVHWVFDHIEEMGGSRQKIVLSGHSAGGYLAMMMTFNKTYLEKHNIDADNLMGIVPFSGQTVTHFTARQENGIDINQPVIDAYAPLFWMRKDIPPTTLITGGRDLEMVARYEENAYLKRMLEIVGNTNVKLLELDGYDHGMVYPALPLLLKEVRDWQAKLPR